MCCKARESSPQNRIRKSPLSRFRAERFRVETRYRNMKGVNEMANKDEAKGRLKEAAGDLTGDKDLKREGKVDRATGSVKDKVDDAADAVKDKVGSKKDD